MKVLFQDTGQRAHALTDVRKVVIKVGTRLLTSINDSSKGERITQLIAQVAALQASGLDVILVSSGAIGAGMLVLENAKRPASLPQLQAHAAVGQSRLMYLYETACQQYGFHCAQILLTAADVQDRERHLNVTSCIEALLNRKVLPIINENDSVSVDEIKFGDNDMLAALVAVMSKADLTILLTSVDGLYEVKDNHLTNRISVVPKLTRTIMTMARRTDDERFSVGGMITKLQAAAHVTKAGENLWIADGRDFTVLSDIFAGKDVGTLFTAAKSTRMRGRQRYLAFFSEYAGDIIVDAGAEQALLEQGRSLLPSGIVNVKGCFKRGDTVRIMTDQEKEIARGVTNYSSEEIARIKGCHTRAIRGILGYDGYDAVVHRNYMVLTT
ncbi:MAG: glutamate 5-kinase [Candidatus Pacebacteria bacterium]|nr:glutamate 5-kinase [Candidatus Paceibacterota bacterium]